MFESFLLLALTVVVIIKLNQQLGQHNGFFKQQQPEDAAKDASIQDIPAHKIKRIAVGYEDISEIDPNFTPEDFVAKCTEVFKYVVQNFYSKNLQEVSNFIEPSFLRKMEHKLEGIAKQQVEFVDRVFAKLMKHEVKDGEANIWVQFDSTQKIDTEIADHSDVWVFTKSKHNPKPNWYLKNIEY